MEASEYEAQIAALERENRILKQRLLRSEANRVMLEELLETHSNALKARNTELEESQELIRQSEVKYRNLALHDILTGLPNRTLLQERLIQAMDRARQYRTCFALLYIDLDRFKPVNDKWGHEAGDMVLREAACRLRNCVRGEDTVARIGGDEFTILLENLQEPGDAKGMAERVIATMNEPFLVLGNSCVLSVSIGICCFPADGDNADALVKKADAAMYRIKKGARNGYRFFQSRHHKTFIG